MNSLLSCRPYDNSSFYKVLEKALKGALGISGAGFRFWLEDVARRQAVCQYMNMSQENVQHDNNLGATGLDIGSLTARVIAQSSTSPAFRGEHVSHDLAIPYDISLVPNLTQELTYTDGCVPLWELSDDPGKGVKVVMWRREVPGQKDPLFCAVMRTPDNYRSGEELPFADPDDSGPGEPGEYIPSLQQPSGLIKYRYLDEVDLAGDDSLTQRVVIQKGNPVTIFRPNSARPIADGSARQLSMPGTVIDVVGYR